MENILSNIKKFSFKKQHCCNGDSGRYYVKVHNFAAEKLINL